MMTMTLRKGMKFSVDEDERLIAIVALYPCVYNTEHSDFKNVQIKAKVWETIQNSVGRSEEQCKKRWRAIRDNFWKIKKGKRLGKVKWYLYEQLKFLENVRYNGRLQNTIEDDSLDPLENDTIQDFLKQEEPEDTQDSYDNDSEAGASNVEPACSKTAMRESSGFTSGSSTPSSTGNSRKRKLMKQLSTKEEDDVDTFMKSIALTIKNLPPKKIAKIKMGILSLVTEVQFSEDV